MHAQISSCLIQRAGRQSCHLSTENNSRYAVWETWRGKWAKVLLLLFSYFCRCVSQQTLRHSSCLRLTCSSSCSKRCKHLCGVQSVTLGDDVCFGSLILIYDNRFQDTWLLWIMKEHRDQRKLVSACINPNLCVKKRYQFESNGEIRRFYKCSIY